MTEKELRKLNRYQLLELLIMQTERADELEKKLEAAEAQIQEQELRFSRLGSIAEASLEVTGVFEAAQKAADLYLENARRQAEEIVETAEKQAEEIRNASTSGAYLQTNTGTVMEQENETLKTVRKSGKRRKKREKLSKSRG